MAPGQETPLPPQPGEGTPPVDQVDATAPITDNTVETEPTETPIELPENLSEIDPAIDPKNLVVQEGSNMGRINAFDTEPGKALDDFGERKDLPNSEQPYTVEGIVPVGAAIENDSRSQNSEIDEDKWDKIEEANPNADGAEVNEMYHDEVGTDALVGEIVKKATVSLKEKLKDKYPLATDETIANLANEVGEKFRDHLKAKQAEAEAKRQEAEVQEMIKKVQEGTPPSELDPNLDFDKLSAQATDNSEAAA